MATHTAHHHRYGVLASVMAVAGPVIMVIMGKMYQRTMMEQSLANQAEAARLMGALIDEQRAQQGR